VLQVISNFNAVADKSYPEPCYYLALIFESGSGSVQPNQRYSLSLFTEAANLDYLPAISHLGELYEHGGPSMAPIPTESIRFYSIGSSRGDAACTVGLASWYITGLGESGNAFLHPKDERKAFDLVQSVSGKDYPRADYMLGYFFEHGIGVLSNIENAKVCYHNAARKGIYFFNFSLGYNKAVIRLEELHPSTKKGGFMARMFTRK
jgi:TPR repeat protein